MRTVTWYKAGGRWKTSVIGKREETAIFVGSPGTCGS